VKPTTKQSPPDKLIVARLWTAYEWPEWNLPMQKMTIPKLLRYRSQPKYISDVIRTRKQPALRWDYGRIRFFYERLLAGETLEAIDVDNRCDYGHVYPEPVLLDGHHRLAAAHLANAPIILANYGGRVDLLRYLIGARKTCPA
jgi:hypothetical protein